MARTIYIDWENREVYESEEELDNMANAMAELGLRNYRNMELFLLSMGKPYRVSSPAELMENIERYGDEYRSWLFRLNRGEILRLCIEYIIED